MCCLLITGNVLIEQSMSNNELKIKETSYCLLFCYQ